MMFLNMKFFLMIIFTSMGSLSSLEDFKLQKVKSGIEPTERQTCGKASMCFKGTQLCNVQLKIPTCEDCDSYHHDCFTEFQHRDCREYCYDQLNQTLQSCRIHTVTDKETPCLKPFIVSTVASSILLIALLTISFLHCRHKTDWSVFKNVCFKANVHCQYTKTAQGNEVRKVSSETNSTLSGRSRNVPEAIALV